MTKLGSYTLAEDDTKNINHMTHHFSSVDIKYFSAKTFALLGYIDKNHISIPFFLFFYSFQKFQWVFKGCITEHYFNFGEVNKIDYSRPS